MSFSNFSVPLSDKSGRSRFSCDPELGLLPENFVWEVWFQTSCQHANAPVVQIRYGLCGSAKNIAPPAATRCREIFVLGMDRSFTGWPFSIVMRWSRLSWSFTCHLSRARSCSQIRKGESILLKLSQFWTREAICRQFKCLPLTTWPWLCLTRFLNVVSVGSTWKSHRFFTLCQRSWVRQPRHCGVSDGIWGRILCGDPGCRSGEDFVVYWRRGIFSK